MEVHKTITQNPTCCHPLVAIATWGINIVGSFEEATIREYKNILGTILYLFKWAEVVVVRDFITMTVSKFIQIHIIYRFSVPQTITVDNR